MNLNRQQRGRRRSLVIPVLAITLGVLIGLFNGSATVWAGEGDGQPGQGDAARVYGVLDSLPEDGRLGVWTIEGEAYEVNPQTELEADHGPFEPGACLKVKYQASETGRIAVEIETERQYRCGEAGGEGGGAGGDDSRFEARLYGLIVSFPPELEGEWNVGGITIVADESTEFDQEHVPFDQDVMVEVKFYTDEAGAHHALQIESKFAVGNHGGDDHHHGDEGREGHAYGLIEAWPDHSTAGPIGSWIIGGVPYLAMPETRFVQRRHEFGVGVEVRVKYRIDADGLRIARVIRTTGRVGDVDQSAMSRLVSFVEEMPEVGFNGAWKVGNVSLETTDTTHFDEHHGLLAVGAYVEVEYVTDDLSGEAVNYIVKMATRVPPGVGGHHHRGRIRHMGESGLAAAGVAVDEIWTVDGQQIRIVAATDLDDTDIELAVDVLVDIDSYTGDDGIEVATRVRGLSENNKIFLPLTMN